MAVRRRAALLLAAGRRRGAGRRRQRAQELPASLIADQVTYDRETRILTASGNVEVLYQGRVLRADRIIYDEGEEPDPRRGRAPPDRPGRRRPHGRERRRSPPTSSEGLITSARLLIAGKMQMAAAEVRRTGGRYDDALQDHRQLLHHLRREPHPHLGAARLAHHPGRASSGASTSRTPGSSSSACPSASCRGSRSPRPGWSGPRASSSRGSCSPTSTASASRPPTTACSAPRPTRRSPPSSPPAARRSSRASTASASPAAASTSGASSPSTTALGEGGGFGRGAFHTTGEFAPAARLRLRLRPRRRLRRQLPHPVRLFRHRPAHELRPHPPHPRRRVHRARHHRLPEPDRRRTSRWTCPSCCRSSSTAACAATRARTGRLGISLNSLGVLRETGSNSFRAGGQVDWQRDVTLPHGILASGTAQALVDLYQVWDNPDIADGLEVQAAPTLAGELRWPLGPPHRRGRPRDRARSSRSSTSAPCRTRTRSRTRTAGCPSSTRPTSSPSTASPASTGWRPGSAPTSGISYTRQDPAGWSAGFTLGRILRADPVDEFASGTGLDGRWSDYVAAVSVDFAWGLTAINRALFDTGMGFRRNEFALAYDGDFGALRAAYVYLAEDDSDPDPRAAARDQRDLARRPLPGAAELGAARALALRRRRPARTCAPAPGSPTATSAPSSTFPSRAATPHRITCRPRRRSASACVLRASARRGRRTGRRASACAGPDRRP